MRVLIVGAGAVGQVYGHYLARGGADVEFLVKPKYLAELAHGFTLYHLPNTEPDTLHTRAATAPSGVYDAVILTVSSDALRAGEWLAELARATADATVLVLQPGLDDRSYIEERVAPERLVDGTIHFLAYHAPMPGETRFATPGVAYWLFPGKGPMSGTDPARVDALIKALAAGELPVKRVADTRVSAAFSSVVLGSFVAALEAADWSLAEMRRAGWVRLGARAARQALAIAAHERGVPAPLGARLVAHPLAFRALVAVASVVAPVDLETYLEVHFTKVGVQMHANLAALADHGRRAGLPVDALDELSRCIGGGHTVAGNLSSNAQP
jgi:ketopantoate reductase